ncbi:hypothetical protein C0J52_12040 [Blattella germanica]|nr:hypothetical protein C0J52_12040 [Blattella germanica]
MSSFSVSVIVLAFLSLNAYAAKFPSSFQLCRKNDPSVDTCLIGAIEKALKTMADGIPSLHVLPIDPQAVTQILVQDSPGRPVNFNINLTDATLKGLRNTKFGNIDPAIEAKPTLDALNTNWETFWAELRPSIEESFSYIFKNLVSDILKKVPEKNMFLPDN